MSDADHQVGDVFRRTREDTAFRENHERSIAIRLSGLAVYAGCIRADLEIAVPLVGEVTLDEEYIRPGAEEVEFAAHLADAAARAAAAH